MNKMGISTVNYLILTATRATVKAGTQERGTEQNGTRNRSNAVSHRKFRHTFILFPFRVLFRVPAFDPAFTVTPATKYQT